MKNPVRLVYLLPILFTLLLSSCDTPTDNTDSHIFVIARINNMPQICQINLAPKELIPLTNFDGLVAFTVQRNLEYIHTPLLISPNGKLLLFQGNTTIGSIPDDFDWKEMPTEEMYEEWGYKSIDELYVFDLTSGETRQVTNHSTDVLYADWSPDSTEIAFIVKEERGFNIYTIHVDGTELRSVVSEDERSTMGLSWSVNGQHIAFSKVWDIFTVNPKNPNNKEIISNGVDSRSPRWSPTEMLLATIKGRKDENAEGGRQGVFLSDEMGDSSRRITPTKHSVRGYDWSPDGSKLVYAKSRFLSYSIYVVNKDGSEPMRLYWTWGYGNSVNAPFWSNDGNFVIFTRHKGMESSNYTKSLLSVPADGSGKAEIIWAYEFK